MSTSTEQELTIQLTQRLSLSILKPSRMDRGGNSVSVAISNSGSLYWGGKVESDSNLLDITSEQSSLLLAAQHGDFGVTRVVTLVDTEIPSVSPLSLKIISDWSVRTEISVSYQIITKEGASVFKTDNARLSLPWYVPQKQALTLPKKRLGNNFEKNTEYSSETLKQLAAKGLTRGFHNYDGATAYGVSVRTKSGMTYYTSQYSSPDKRLGVHAEVAGLVSAFMHGERDITHLGLISPKFKTSPCAPCGACRQFIGEFSKKNGWDLTILSFASESDDILSFSVNELIPHMWAS